MSVGQIGMRLAHHLLRHPSGVWHFRLIVPADLRTLLGRRVIKKSLGTRDPVVARAWAYALGAQYAQAFAAARGQGARMGSDFDKFVKGLKGYEIEHGPEPHQVKIRTNGTPEDNQAAHQALTLLKEALRGSPARRPSWDTAPPAAPSMPPAAGPAVPNRPRAIGLVADAWLKSIQADTLRKTMTIKTAAVMGFARHVGLKKMLHEVQREDVHAWVEALRGTGLQTPTLVNKTSYLRGFFTWAVQAGHYPKFPKDESPAMGHVIFRAREKIKRKAMGFKAFTADQVRMLYAPAALDKLSEGARWGAVIGLYTGARVSEVGQLELANFSTEDGVPCLTITDEGEGQSLKNGASRRTIPIHPDLLALGLMERVDKVVPGNAELERFEVKALFDADPGQVKVLSRDDAAALISGIVHLYPLSAIQSDENVQLTIFGLRSSSGSDLILFHQRADAEKELKILREKRLAAKVGSIRPRRGGRPH